MSFATNPDSTEPEDPTPPSPPAELGPIVAFGTHSTTTWPRTHPCVRPPCSAGDSVAHVTVRAPPSVCPDLAFRGEVWTQEAPSVSGPFPALSPWCLAHAQRGQDLCSAPRGGLSSAGTWPCPPQHPGFLWTDGPPCFSEVGTDGGSQKREAWDDGPDTPWQSPTEAGTQGLLPRLTRV
ncbi:uncharacterized protein LOC144226468 [Crocuta crocuta]